MNDLVRELAYGLARTDTDLAISGDAVVVIVDDAASVPPIHGGAKATQGLPGFDAILLDGAGTPTHYCRCRPAGDTGVAHEVAITRAAAADASVARHLQRSALAATSRLSARVSPYERGRPYDGLIAEQSTAEWAATVEEIAGITERMAGLVAGALPELVPSLPVRFTEEAAWALDCPDLLEVPVRQRDALLRVLVAGGTVAPMLQHGDLRPPSIVRGDAGWVLLDVGDFGSIRTPLYDLFHLLRTSLALRGAEGKGVHALWVDTLRDPGDDPTAARAILRRAVRRHDIAPEAALAALAHYLLDRVARAHAGRGRQGTASRDLEEADRLAELLRQGAGPVAFGFAAA